ncbi:hypothetical protein GCM10022245_00790 [Streptomyces mayteni]
MPLAGRLVSSTRRATGLATERGTDGSAADGAVPRGAGLTDDAVTGGGAAADGTAGPGRAGSGPASGGSSVAEGDVIERVVAGAGVPASRRCTGVGRAGGTASGVGSAGPGVAGVPGLGGVGWVVLRWIGGVGEVLVAGRVTGAAGRVGGGPAEGRGADGSEVAGAASRGAGLADDAVTDGGAAAERTDDVGPGVAGRIGAGSADGRLWAVEGAGT